MNWNAHDTLLREESQLQNTQYIIGEFKKICEYVNMLYKPRKSI